MSVPLLALLGASSLFACRRERPRATSLSSLPSGSSANARTAPSADSSKLLALRSASAAAPVKPKDPTLARIEARRPVALDEAAKRRADSYLKALGAGRQATSAKAYDRAETLFSSCLELSPDDPRALAERGYARLLAGKVAEADADFAAATQHAPSSVLLQQILHNRMLAARQRGDEAKAREFASAEQEQKAARRVAPGVDCTYEVKPISMRAERPQSLADAWTRMAAAHVAEAVRENENLAPKAGELILKDGPVPADVSEAELWPRMTGGSRRDGGWVVISDDPNGVTSAAHLLFAKAGQLFVQFNQAFNWSGRCGPSGGKLELAGGGTVPWHATVLDSEAYPSLLCEWPDGKHAPCDGSSDGKPVQSYCTWTSHGEEVVIFDAESFEGLVSISARAQPRNERQDEPVSLITTDFQPTKVVARVCGNHQEVPYDLGAKPTPGAGTSP